VGPAPIEVNGQLVREYRRPLMFGPDGRPPQRWADDLPYDRGALDAALRGQDGYSTVTVEGERVRVYSTPAIRNERIVGAVQTAIPLGEQQRLAESQYRTLLLLLPLALVVAGLGGLFLTNRALQPVRDVTQAAAQIGAEDLSRRLQVTGKDELAELSRTFNGMIARLEHAFGGLEHANAELAEAYGKLERAYQEQRRFTGDASHELRTPLTRIKGSTSLALCGPHDADSYREALVVADEAADAMARIVQDLLLLARSDAGQLPVRLQPLPIEEAIQRSLLSLASQPGAPIRIEIPPGKYRVVGDLDHLARLFTNLLENALRHTPANGSIIVAARPAGDRLEVSVADTGEGIPAEHLPHVCERFYRVDAARSGARGGTGLGLAICQSIVQAHGGALSIRSQPGFGTTVTVTLPLAAAPARGALPEPAAAR
jgi:signal transduction histidine kinase